jgi:hypothetical protein
MDKLCKIKPFVGQAVKKWLSDDGYHHIEINCDKFFQYISARKIYNDCDFEVEVSNDLHGTTLYLTVFSLWPVPNGNKILCLKLLNYINAFEKDAKYYLYPNPHILVCSTFHSISKPDCSLSNLLKLHSECSMENLIDVLWAVVDDDASRVVKSQELKNYM